LSQQINLLNPALRPKVEMLTLNNVALVVSVVFVGVLLLGVWGQQRYAAAQERVRGLEQQMQSAQAQLVQLVGMKASRRPSAALEQLLADRKQLAADKQEVLSTLESGVLGRTDGFSSYMEAMARRVPDGLWLTGFSAGNDEQQLTIQGRMLSESLLPRFIQQMNQEPALQGRTFAALKIEQQEPRSESVQEDAAKPAERPSWHFLLGAESKKGQP